MNITTRSLITLVVMFLVAISAGCDKDIVDPPECDQFSIDDARSLHDAARNDCLNLARRIIEVGTDVDTKNISTGRTPLHDAAWFNSPNVTKLLIQNGANVNAVDTGEGHSHVALHWAARHNSDDVAKILIENGADVNAVSDHGDVPLHYAALCENDCVEVAMRLIEAGANLNIRNTKGAPPLGFTFAYRNSEVAQLLIRNGADTTGISPWWSE